METRSRIVVSLVLFYLLACFSALGVTPTPVSGTISANTTWTLANSPYSVTADVTVDAGVTLTIEPGTIVKFAYSPTTSPPHGSYSYKTRMFINGTLVAAGTDSSPIVFTSERDDNHGGDSNGDGVATLPEAGGWGYIKINGDGSVLEWCVFEYGGIGRLSSVSAYSSEAYTSHTYMLWIQGPNPPVHVRNSVFRHAFETALRYETGSHTTMPEITGNDIADCPSGIYLIANSTTVATITNNTIDASSVMAIHVDNTTDSILSQNTITASDGTGICLNTLLGAAVLSSNSIQGSDIGVESVDCSPTIQNNTLSLVPGAQIYKHTGTSYPTYIGNTVVERGTIAVSGTISTDTTWQDLKFPYYITADVTVDAGVTLTIEPGTIVKFAYSPTTSPPHGSYSYKTRMFINGTLVAAGTDSSPIVFTSERDDNHGGDSNGDGVATLPEAGGWGYIKINGDGSVLEWCVFEYGGIGRLSSVSAYSSEAYTSHTYMLWITEPDVYITRCLFTHAYDKAIYVVESSVNSRTVISSSTFEHSPMGIEFYGNGQEGSEFIVTGNSFDSGSVGVKVTRAGSYVGISRNHFDNLSSYGVQNTDSSSTVIAEGNWWGADDGPDGAGSGSGVDVSAYVNYSSWWTEPDADQNGVWNVIAVRRGTSMIIDIYYDLVGAYGTTYQVGLSVSTTGGEPYTISPASGSLSGTGSGKSPGDGLHIVWDAAAGGGSGYTDQMRVKVTADIE